METKDRTLKIYEKSKWGEGDLKDVLFIFCKSALGTTEFRNNEI